MQWQNSGNPDTNPSFSQERTFQMGRSNELIFQEPIMIQRGDWYQNEVQDARNKLVCKTNHSKSNLIPSLM
jgi:hypothetical protein